MPKNQVKNLAKNEDNELVLEPRHIQAAAMLAEGSTYDAAGRAVGVTAQTIRNWIDNVPGFRREVEIRAKESADRLQLLAQAARLDLMDLASNIGDTLSEALSAMNARGNPDWQTRLKAAELVLRHGVPARPDGEGGRAQAQAAVLVVSRDDVMLAAQHTGTVVDVEAE